MRSWTEWVQKFAFEISSGSRNVQWSDSDFLPFAFYGVKQVIPFFYCLEELLHFSFVVELQEYLINCSSKLHIYMLFLKKVVSVPVFCVFQRSSEDWRDVSRTPEENPHQCSVNEARRRWPVPYWVCVIEEQRHSGTCDRCTVWTIPIMQLSLLLF